MVNRYARPRTSVWGFDSTIGIRFTNCSGPLCGLYVSRCIFTCLTFRCFTFCSSCKLGRGEWMNMKNHMLDGLHVYITNFFVPQEKKLLGGSDFSKTRENLQIDLSWRSWGSSISSKGKMKMWLGIIRILNRLFSIQGECITLVTNIEGTSGSYTSTEQFLGYQ